MEVGDCDLWEKHGKYVCRNKKTGKLSKQVFEDVLVATAYWDDEGLIYVKKKDGWTLFNQKLCMTFQSRFNFMPNYNNIVTDIKKCLSEHPEDFALLPTRQFLKANRIEGYLDAAAEGVKKHCCDQEVTEDFKEYVNKIKELCANKIKIEKENIRRINDDFKKVWEKYKIKEAQQKARVEAINKATEEISNLKSILNDDERKV